MPSVNQPGSGAFAIALPIWLGVLQGREAPPRADSEEVESKKGGGKKAEENSSSAEAPARDVAPELLLSTIPYHGRRYLTPEEAPISIDDRV